MDACFHGASLDVIRLLVREKPWLCLFHDYWGMLPLDMIKYFDESDSDSDEENIPDFDAIYFVERVTNAAASVLTDTILKSKKALPRETYGHVATLVHGLPEEVAILKMGLTQDAIHALLQRDAIRTMIRAPVLNANIEGYH